MQVKHSVLNCFINIPLDFARIIVVVGDKEATKKTLFDILEHEVMNTKDDKYLSTSRFHSLFEFSSKLLGFCNSVFTNVGFFSA